MGSLINLTGGRENGEYSAPASAMAKGLAVVISGSTIAKCGAATRPDGFLLTAVTTDGLSYQELLAIPHAEVEETKVSVGKVRFVEYVDGVEIATDNNNSETWSVGDKILCIANGVLSNVGDSGDYYIGKVISSSHAAGGETGLERIKLSKDLGTKA